MGTPLLPSSVLDVIAALVEASLLRSETRAGRDHALSDAGDDPRIRARNGSPRRSGGRPEAACVLPWAFAERYELAELLPDGDQVLALLEAEHANLRAALAWLEDTDECGALLRLAGALGRFWTGRGYSHESRDWLERALAHDGAAAADRAKALVALGVIQIYQGANREAEPRLTEGLAGCRALGDALHEVLALIGLSGLAIMQGNLDRGAALWRKRWPPPRVWQTAGWRGSWRGGSRSTSPSPLGRKVSTRWPPRTSKRRCAWNGRRGTDGMILALGDLGNLARDQADYARALAFYREALELGGNHPGRAWSPR